MKKKLLTIVLALAACLCLCFGLAACGGASVTGKYYLYENGKYDKTSWIELKSGTWETSASGGEPASGGDYELKGEQIVLYIDLLGSKQIFSQGTVKNGVLTLTTMGVTRSFYKEGAAGGSQNGTTNGGTNGGTNNPSTGKTYTVTYDANGGAFTSGGTFTQQAQGDSALTAPTSPTRQYYTFAGWAKNKGGTEMWDFSKDKVTANTTLYAVWSQKSATVLSVEGASIDEENIFMLVTPQTTSVRLADKVVCSDDSYWQLYYDALGQTEIPTKVAANLGGALANGQNVFYIVVTSQDRTQVNTYILTVYRQYTVNVTYMTNGAVYRTREIVTGTPLTQDYDIACSVKGYTFNGWEHTEKFGENVWGPVTFTADLTANTYKVTFDSAGGSEVAEKTVTFGQSYSFTKLTRTGYTFLGWWAGSTQLTDEDGSIGAWNIDNDTQVTAHWQVNKYQLTVETNNSSAGSVRGGGEFDYDSNVTVTATTNQGYTFLGWYDARGDLLSEEARYTFKMGLAATITAKWTYYTVTVSRNNTSAGTLSQNYNATKITAGEQVSITATTNKGYTWVGWYSGETELTKELTYSFTMGKENVNAVARWSKVTLTQNDRYAGSVTALDGTYAAGDKVTITATTNKGYTFIGWYKGEEEVSTELSYQITMGKEDETYTARWSKVTLTRNNSSAGSVGGLDSTYKVGDDATITATTNKGYTFVGWYKGEEEVSTDLSCQITMGKENVTYEARWELVDGMEKFNFTSTLTTCTITGLKDKTATEIVIPDCVTEIYSPSGAAPEKGAFANCSGIKSVTIGSGVTSIGDYAFYGCSGLTSITIPDSVTSIGWSAFEDCSGLTSVTIGSGVTKIGYDAFENCSGLTGVYITNLVAWCNIDFVDNPLECAHHLYLDKAEVKDLIIPAEITRIKKLAFEDCDGLTSITIHDGVTKIGDYAFYNCSGLTSVTIGSGVTRIGQQAFNGCDGLISVTFKNLNGWVVRYQNLQTFRNPITSDKLENPSTAAESLKNYSSGYYYWTRED